jgi:hypothetical protein
MTVRLCFLAGFCGKLNVRERTVLPVLRITMQQALSVLALNGRNERFIYIYDDSSRDTLLDHIRNQAANPAVAVSWSEYLLLAERARRQAKESAALHHPVGE